MTPRVYFSIRGLGADKQLSRLISAGYALFDISRTDLHTLEFGCRVKNADSVRTILTERGFICTRLPDRGSARRLKILRARTPFILALLLSFFFLSAALRCIWRIDIVGAGPYIGEIRAYLKEENIFPGISADRLSLKTISADLTRRLPRVAWIHASFEGLSLKIAVTQGVPMPEIETEGSNGDIIAERDGIIESISVYAGTPAVQAGECVKAGDVLIRGYERSTNDTLIPVRARGKITARTYISASASVAADALSTHRTGRSETVLYLRLSFLSIPLTPSPAYLSTEYQSVFTPLGGAWLPALFERRTVYEVYFSQESPDEDALRAEADRLCLQKLISKCAKNDEIIDKWLYYSMIEGGILSASATALVRTELGIFSPETQE